VPAIWEKNVRFHQANRLSEKNVFKLALSDEVQETEFFLPVYTTGLEEEQTGTLNAQSWQTSEKNVERIKVQCVTLDNFAATNALPPGRCCVKIDVENHEVAVLKGAQEFIRSRRPWILCEILYGQKVDPATGGRVNDNQEIVNMIEQIGYVPFVVTDEGLFRMSTADFDRPRTFKDFLLVPASSIPNHHHFLPISTLHEFLQC
jgi:FkbM family methyltransferase